MSKDALKSMDEIFKDLPVSNEEPKVRRMIGVWIPEDYHERFGILQTKTNDEFGKRIQALIMQAIDLVDKRI